jgi:hypothetical protein
MKTPRFKIAGRKVFLVQGRGIELRYASEDLLQTRKYKQTA